MSHLIIIALEKTVAALSDMAFAHESMCEKFDKLEAEYIETSNNLEAIDVLKQKIYNFYYDETDTILSVGANLETRINILMNDIKIYKERLESKDAEIERLKESVECMSERLKAIARHCIESGIPCDNPDAVTQVAVVVDSLKATVRSLKNEAALKDRRKG